MNIYDSYIDGAQELPERERERFYRAVIEFLRYGYEPELPAGPARGMFAMIRPSLELSRSRSKAGQKKSKTENKSESKRTSKLNQTMEQNDDQNSDQNEIKSTNKTESNDETNDQSKGVTKNKYKNKKEKLSPNGESKKKAASRFQPPTIEEVAEYAKSMGYGPPFDASRFCDFYQSKGWIVGKSKMIDWRAAVRGWVSRDRREIAQKHELTGFDEYA